MNRIGHCGNGYDPPCPPGIESVTISYTRRDGSTAQVETVQVVPRMNVPRPGDAATVWYDTVTGEAIGRVGSPQSHGGAATFPDTPHAS
ncbi:hypothetical protein AWC19_27310 [Mycobacterium palustre]|uniref:Uncharacterized protein n=2 Tax=Mycobacterium palustre TaxID=153971 RepID=A0A1X1ZVT7_9MYCO|nr:hypothetical protein AWC19_27310 [Mycobacterium palustre]